MENINKTVKHLISVHLGIDEHKIQNNSRLKEDLGADSLDHIEIVMAIEDEFGCDIPDLVMENLKTVQDILNYLEEI